MKKQPMYLGIFVKDQKQASKTIKGVAKESMIAVSQIFEEKIIVDDLISIQQYHSPAGTYHLTSLFIRGKSADKLNKQQKIIYKDFEYGSKVDMAIQFIAYVPNYLLCGFITVTEKIGIENQLPHITMLLKNKAKAVESNSVLQAIFSKNPDIFKERKQKITRIQTPYGKSQCIYVIDTKMILEGITGSDISHKK